VRSEGERVRSEELGVRSEFLGVLLACLMLGACSFDYGSGPEEDTSQPDIVMENLEYVRVRGGDPQVRFRAESAERYEETQTMNLRNFSFDQFEQRGDEINASGSAEDARVELDSGNIRMNGDVRIAVDSEDIIIETTGLDWKDKERHLSADPSAPVEILRSDGTKFTGIGFSANTRSRTWEFSGSVSGSYVDEDDDEGEDETGEEDPGEEESGEEE
jgi:LPS export ABC transporter protein LptC